MARGSKISRERLLAAAEQLVERKGAAALTIGALALEAGVSKGGVQTMFGTKEALILDLVQRWLDRDQAAFRDALKAQAAPDATAAHINLTESLDSASHAKFAALLTVAAHSPEHSALVRPWYDERASGFQAGSPEERRKRLAFLATEGAYFLRFLVGIDFDDAAWADVFADIRTLADTADSDGPALQ